MRPLKNICLLALVFLLAGCRSQAQSTVQESAGSEEVTQMANSQDSVVEEVIEEDTTPPGRKADGTRQAWTNYSHYAEPDESGYAYYMYPDPDVSSEIFPLNYEASSSKVLLFTFDDAPRFPEPHTVEMAQIMKEMNVNGIFLVNGMHMETEEGKAIVKEVYDMGFEIGNHTYYHENLREQTYEEQYAAIQGVSQLVEEVTGEAPRWFRPPFGLFNMDTIHICNELGLQLMTWNFGYDWMEEYQSGPALTEISLSNEYLRDGANILMHDHAWTRDALQAMIEGYRQQGYEIVDPLLIQAQQNSTEPIE